MAFWVQNGITIGGLNVLTLSEDVARCYGAYGWQVLTGQDGS